MVTLSENAMGDAAIVAMHWDRQTPDARASRTRWWESRTILRHINKVVCGQPLEGPSAGFHALLKQWRPDGYRRAVSVGCGAGYKEAALVLSGMVQNFFLYEISAERVRQGQEFARSRGIGDRMHFVSADAFEACREQFDLVYWNNALHHMMDVPAAVSWSRSRLAPKGVFAMDDYVGASRFQWSDYSLDIASRFREGLDPAHLRGAPARITRPSAEKLMSVDPSEAADSARTIPALKVVFPDIRIIPTGGAIYHPGLNDILANIGDESEVLSMALLLDDVMARQGETHYGVAVTAI
ncbi:class I SAM-dependent methyltransferase [Sphingobium estronivorans]|uniref:class I SAM-dependent methyltransferase n=1 Tax=Sphingobium estronivorans TaxID=1577690 RepID=UPI00123A050E|nr:methyltransferase domain-containing protein [Sphingobium estronivorans]